LSKVISFPAGHELTGGLRKLETEITTLRKTGESIVETAKDLDKAAREKVDSVIRVSQIAIVVDISVVLRRGHRGRSFSSAGPFPGG